jgi:hypothetical protein
MSICRGFLFLLTPAQDFGRIPPPRARLEHPLLPAALSYRLELSRARLTERLLHDAKDDAGNTSRMFRRKPGLDPGWTPVRRQEYAPLNEL